MTIRNPVEWGADQVRNTVNAIGASGSLLHRREEELDTVLPRIRHITYADLGEALRKGFDDFAAYRTDVIFLSLIYPVAGLVLARVALGYDMLPSLFPLASGFALIGPFAAAGLYEMSRRRETGETIGWIDALGVVRSPSFWSIFRLGLVLALLFACWMLTAAGIYNVTLGPAAPASLGGFVRDVFTTPAGFAMIVLGVGVGFLYALLVLSISVVSFPLLLDRKVRVLTAMSRSVEAVGANPGPMMAWGLIVAAGLVLGSLPLLAGLIVVMPVLGHATWHLYRKVMR